MIKSWKSKKVRKVVEGEDGSDFPGVSRPMMLRRLAVLDAATEPEDLEALGCLGMTRHGGKGDRDKGRWRVAVDGLWALEFRVRRGNVFDVDMIRIGEKEPGEDSS